MKRPVIRVFGLATAPMRGFSLVELMVAMALSLLLLGGVVAIFASSRSSYETTDKLSRIQENGRFALDQFTHDIRESGFVGCARFPPVVSSSLDPSQFLYDFVSVNGFKPVSGFQFMSDTTWSPAIPADAGLPNDLVPGSDILALRLPARGVAPQKLQKDALGTDELLFPKLDGTFKTGDTVMLYSCGAQAIFQATDFSGGTMKHSGGLNATNDLHFDFPAAVSQAVPINTVLYYVAPKFKADPKADPKDVPSPSLWRKVGPQPPEEMVEGVEQMQIDYGLDTNNDYVVDDYKTADLITNWDQVFSVRVALLVRSLETYGSDKDTKERSLLTGADVVPVPAPNDGYYREVFTSTVVIRNKAVTQ